MISSIKFRLFSSLIEKFSGGAKIRSEPMNQNELNCRGPWELRSTYYNKILVDHFAHSTDPKRDLTGLICTFVALSLV